MTVGGSTATLGKSEWISLAALLLVGLALQFLFVPIDADVSWLITVSERVLSGDRLYVDIFEVNPPASVWLYLPQVALAQAIGLRPETLIVLITSMLATASVIATLRLNDRLAAAPRLPLTLALGFLVLILPGGLFAQREHYALLLALPLAWTMMLVADRKPIETRWLVAAGAAAGLILVIKPQFLFAVALPAAYAGWASGRWRDIAIAAGAGIFVVLLYALAIITLASAYLSLVPMLAEVYGPMREHWPKLIFGVSVATPLALSMIAWILSPKPAPRKLIVLLLMVVGFTIAVIIQGKGYWNHALPGVALAVVAMVLAALEIRKPIERRAGTLFVTAVAIGVTATMLMIQPPAGLVTAMRAVAPQRPTVITLGTDLYVGHPATRLVDGRWAGTRAALFTAAGVRYRTRNFTDPASTELRHWYDEDIALLERDIAKSRPQVLLVETEDMSWLSKEPASRRILAQYRLVRTVGDIEIWLRRPVAAPQ